jgi:hypothetical protein
MCGGLYDTDVHPGEPYGIDYWLTPQTRREKFRLFLRKLFQVPFKEITMTTKKKLKVEIEVLKRQLKHKERANTEWREAFKESNKRYEDLQAALGDVVGEIVDKANLVVRKKKIVVPERSGSWLRSRS